MAQCINGCFDLKREIQKSKQINPGRYARNKMQMIMIQSPRTGTIVGRERGHQVKLPGGEFKFLIMMAHDRMPIQY